MRIVVLLIGVITLFCACETNSSATNTEQPPQLITFGDTNPLVDFDARMAEPKYPVEIDGVPIKSCADLFAAIDEGIDPSLASGTKPFSGYMGCFDLPLICHARPAAANPWPEEGVAEEIYQSLDIGTFGTSLYHRRSAESHRFADFELPSPEFSRDGFTIQTEDWYFSVHLATITDFDGNGVADVLAWYVDHAKRASYWDSSPLIFSREGSGSTIRGRRVFQSVLDDSLATWPDDPMTCDHGN